MWINKWNGLTKLVLLKIFNLNYQAYLRGVGVGWEIFGKWVDNQDGGVICGHSRTTSFFSPFPLTILKSVHLCCIRFLESKGALARWTYLSCLFCLTMNWCFLNIDPFMSIVTRICPFINYVLGVYKVTLLYTNIFCSNLHFYSLKKLVLSLWTPNKFVDYFLFIYEITRGMETYELPQITWLLES